LAFCGLQWNPVNTTLDNKKTLITRNFPFHASILFFSLYFNLA
jgi:hypothetical protein